MGVGKSPKKKRRTSMNQDQRALIAVVFDMVPGQLRAVLYQIILGDDVKTAINKARAWKLSRPKSTEKELFG
jgi:hypothetical protein